MSKLMHQCPFCEYYDSKMSSDSFYPNGEHKLLYICPSCGYISYFMKDKLQKFIRGEGKKNDPQDILSEMIKRKMKGT